MYTIVPYKYQLDNMTWQYQYDISWFKGALWGKKGVKVVDNS